MLCAFLKLPIHEVFQIKTSLVCITTFQLPKFSRMNGYNLTNFYSSSLVLNAICYKLQKTKLYKTQALPYHSNLVEETEILYIS